MNLCSKCGEVKPLSDFYFYKKRGLPFSTCKGCTNAARNLRRLTNLERSREKGRLQSARYRLANPEKNREWCLAWRSKNQAKHRSNAKKWGRNNPERVWARNISRYGLTPEGYRAMERNQESRCAICNKAPSKKRLHIDHDHDTGAVRALLCTSCNTGLGLFREDTALLDRAAQYLNQHNFRLVTEAA